MNSQSTDRRKNFAKFISERFVFRIHKELKSITINTSVFLKTKDFRRHLTEDTQIINMYIKMLNSINN